MSQEIKYSDKLIDDLVKLGYTHCFFVGGGNVMHLLESARTRMICVPVVHEVSAGIAAEYFNVAMRESNSRAVAFVTAGPGLTNMITAIGGAWLESRELLVIGGQARTEFLSRGTVRQIGHQEIDGVGITRAITKASKTIESPLSFEELKAFSDLSRSGRKGPVFLELCLDVSASYIPIEETPQRTEIVEVPAANVDFSEVQKLWATAQRPLMLVGQGLEYLTFASQMENLRDLQVPIATSWNAADYLSFDDELYAGRPNTYGMRWANAAIQQSDLVIVVGARLGLQQTGFNWDDFVPVGKIVHLEIDSEELKKDNPGSDLRIQCDANVEFGHLISSLLQSGHKPPTEWLDFIQHLKSELPTNEVHNNIFDEAVNPFAFIDQLSDVATGDDIVIPCSSGGSYTTVMQAFRQKQGQLITNDKGLASMGYGLAGAIGASLAMPNKRVIHIEGDGGFAQNLSEIGTVANRNLNLKMIVFENGGYASIRVSQKSYFAGNYVGCDAETGVGLPDWEGIFSAYGIPSAHVNSDLANNADALALLNQPGPGALIVHIHKDQPFLPKLTSRIFKDGSMKSNPIHLMHPPLSREKESDVFRFLPESLRHSD